MASLQHPTPIRPLQVEIDGIPKYRQARSVEDLAAFLLSQQGRMSKTIGPRFIMRWRPRWMPCSSVSIRRLRQAFVEAAHVSRMHVLPDDMVKMKDAG